MKQKSWTTAFTLCLGLTSVLYAQSSQENLYTFSHQSMQDVKWSSNNQSVIVTPDGTVHTVFLAKGSQEIYYITMNPNVGNTFMALVSDSQEAFVKAIPRGAPVIAIEKEGKIHILFAATRNGQSSVFHVSKSYDTANWNTQAVFPYKKLYKRDKGGKRTKLDENWESSLAIRVKGRALHFAAARNGMNVSWRDENLVYGHFENERWSVEQAPDSGGPSISSVDLYVGKTTEKVTVVYQPTKAKKQKSLGLYYTIRGEEKCFRNRVSWSPDDTGKHWCTPSQLQPEQTDIYSGAPDVIGDKNDNLHVLVKNKSQASYGRISPREVENTKLSGFQRMGIYLTWGGPLLGYDPSIRAFSSHFINDSFENVHIVILTEKSDKTGSDVKIISVAPSGGSWRRETLKVDAIPGDHEFSEFNTFVDEKTVHMVALEKMRNGSDKFLYFSLPFSADSEIQ